MERKTSSLLLWAAVAAFLCQSLFVSGATNIEDQKNFFHLPTNPSVGTPPAAGSITPPDHGSGGVTPTPSHVTPSYSTPPSHVTPSHGTPPANCGTPPSKGHHKTPSTPSGGHHTTPSPPRKSGGGYYHSPPTSPRTTPSTPTPTPTTPSTPTPTTPTTPTIVTPPTTRTPSTPSISVPSPPSSFDPNSPPFTCTYWKNHPTLIWGVFGIWGTTLGNAFGSPTLPGSTSKLNLLEALSNTRVDGFGDLYKEGTAALLNSLVDKKFPYTTSQVKSSFVAALSSNKAAAAQAQVFKLANERKH